MGGNTNMRVGVNNLQIDFVEILIVQFLEDSGSGFFAIK